MNTKEILEDAKRKAPNLVVYELIQEFEQFASTLTQLQGLGIGDQDQHQAFKEKVVASHDRLKSYFTRVAASFGMTMDQFGEFIGNSNNFDPKDWEEIQASKRELAERFNVRPSKNKRMKNNKNVKI